MMRRLIATIAVCGAVTGWPGESSAQDLFELEVFDSRTAAPGEFDVGIHTNALSGGGIRADSIRASHRPLHLSVEIARGWTSRLETAVFIQTAPFGPNGSARFGGGHVRTRIRLGELEKVPLGIAVSAEYAFNRVAFDGELQTFEVRSILDYAKGRLLLILNPSVEIVTRGGEGLEPVVDVSARAAWRLTRRISIAGDYFSAAATVRHLQPEPEAHHLVFAGVGFEFGSGWELELGTGHCIIAGEPWLIRSVVSYSF